MKVFKFGGASVDSVTRIRNLASILKEFRSEKLLIVISAMGKTTNALEKVAESFYSGETVNALELFEQIKNQHIQIAESLESTNKSLLLQRMGDFLRKWKWLIHDKPSRSFDYYYDQIVCVGELLSTCIISDFLRASGIPNQWVDVRDVFVTNDQFQAADICWEKTGSRISDKILPLFAETGFVVTQGFIGSTEANESTTLGREGSDYSAAIFANIINAESLTIWKDVEGVMNADPKLFPDAIYIRELGYDEVLKWLFMELRFYIQKLLNHCRIKIFLYM